ncbi:MAG: 4a-hydroxytetrahydrobiopterin dehydratase [Methanomicrobiales archaeon]|nr:4a-hydroxytetrahydrobiopterin dehydratase [Methanomicrobiales archaeon]
MKCTPLQPSTQPLTRKEIKALMPQIPDWSLDEGHLVTRYDCRDFAECIRIFGEVIAIAMEEGHFPDICISRSRYVDVLLYTYAIGGLSLNDFILAARISGRTRRDPGASAL